MPRAMDLAAARALPLMGRPESWDGYGRTPLEDVPDGVLRQARSFFNRVESPNARTAEQVAAITAVLAWREANSPQQQLAL
jgi:hypothetical protein